MLRFIYPLEPIEWERWTEPINDKCIEFGGIKHLLDYKKERWLDKPNHRQWVKLEKHLFLWSWFRTRFNTLEKNKYEMSSRKCAYITKLGWWIGSKLSNPPRFDGIGQLDIFFDQMEECMLIPKLGALAPNCGTLH